MIESKISIISFIKTLTERWKVELKSTMTIICLSFKKRNKTLNVKKKTYDEDKRRIIKDEWQRKLEREHSRCQQMLKTNRY